MITGLVASLILLRSPAINFECKATKLSDVMVELSKQCGKELGATGDFGQTFVTIRFANTEPERAMAELAKGLDATWIARGQASYLNENVHSVNGQPQGLQKEIKNYVAQAKKLESLSSQEADKLIKEALEFQEKQTQGQSYDYESYQKFESQNPSSRMLRKLVALKGEKPLLDSKPNTRIVYSTNPTRMQLPLGQEAFRVLAEYDREQATQKESLAKHGITEGSSSNGYYVSILQPYSTDVRGAKEILYIVKNEHNGITVSLEVLTENGEMILESRDTIQSQSNIGREKPAESTVKIEGDFKPSSDAQLMQKAISLAVNNRGKETNPEAKKFVLEVFKNLEQREILSFTSSELILQSSEALKKDAVAKMSDTFMFLEVLPTMSKDLKFQSLWSQFQSFGMGKISEDDGCFYVTPDTAPFGFEFAFSRREISKYVNMVEKSGISIDALASLAKNYDNQDLFMFTLLFANIPFDNAIDPGNLSTGQEALKAYANLDPGSQQKVKNGGYSTTFGSLPSGLRKTIEELIFVHKGKLQEAQNNLDGFEDFSYGGAESTKILGNGIPANATVNMQIRNRNGTSLQTTVNSQFTSTRLVSPENLASSIAYSQVDPNSNQVMKVAEVNFDQLDLTVQFSPKYLVSSRFYLQKPIDPSKYGDYTTLPKETQDLIKKRIEEYKVMYKDHALGSPLPGRIKP